MNRATDAAHKAAKTRCWNAFSRYVRLSSVRDNGLGSCCSCGRTVHWKSADAGHWITRARSSTLFDERNVHIQCRECNRRSTPSVVGAHRRYIEKRYGAAVIEELEQLARRPRRYTTGELEQMADDYLAKARQLEEQIHG